MPVLFANDEADTWQVAKCIQIHDVARALPYKSLR